MILFEKKKEEICKNPKLKKAERDEKIHKLILSLNLRRYCCRMRIMSYKDLVQDIIPIDYFLSNCFPIEQGILARTSNVVPMQKSKINKVRDNYST